MCYAPLRTEVDKPRAIAIKTKSRIYYLKAETPEEWLKWNEEIFNAISDLFIEVCTSSFLHH